MGAHGSVACDQFLKPCYKVHTALQPPLYIRQCMSQGNYILLQGNIPLLQGNILLLLSNILLLQGNIPLLQGNIPLLQI